MKLLHGDPIGELEVFPEAIFTSAELVPRHPSVARQLGVCWVRSLILPIPILCRDLTMRNRGMGDWWTVGWHFIRFNYVTYTFAPARFWYGLIPWKVKRVYGYNRYAA